MSLIGIFADAKTADAYCSWPMAGDVELSFEATDRTRGYAVFCQLTVEQADALAVQLINAASAARREQDDYDEWCRKDEERTLLERLLGIERGPDTWIVPFEF